MKSEIQTLLNQLERGHTDAQTLVESYLQRIEQHNPSIHAVTDILADTARETAQNIDEARLRGAALGPLAGLPVLIKENIDVKGAVCSAGLPLFADHRPTEDAPVVRLLRQAGAIVLGMTATDPGAFGVRTDVTTHPQAPLHSVGGSSGGSAAALAAGLAPAALGTDTGGSVRIPAACCLTASLKPTYGRHNLTGIRPLAWSLDHVGPMVRRVADIAPVQRVLDSSFDLTRSDRGVDDMLIGYDPAFHTEADPEIRDAMEAVLDRISAAGHRVVRVSLPTADTVAAIHGPLLFADAAAYYETAGLTDHPDLPALPKAGIDMGLSLTATDYARAAETRRQVRHQVSQALKHVDILLVPTLPVLTPRKEDTRVVIAGKEYDYTSALVRYTSLFNHSGHPVVAMPANVVKPGIGAGLQVVAAYHRDADAVDYARHLEALLALDIDWTI